MMILTEFPRIGHQVEVEDDEPQPEDRLHTEEEPRERVGLASELAENPSVKNMDIFRLTMQLLEGDEDCNAPSVNLLS